MSDPTTQLPAPAVDPDLEVGQQVGEYLVEGKLGEGAFGIVFRATHPLIGKVVAIKVLARKFSVDPEMVSRFIAEARAVNQIRHRNIIDIFAFGQLADGRHYYVMEYLDGETLDQLLERNGRLSLADALPILRGIGRALDAAHAKGIAHRDLKAENVFLAQDEGAGVFPKLLDFGIAKLMAPEEGLKHKTRTGTPVGTPYYMSPEQCRGRDVDHRTDLYAFGVLAYLLLTGVFPHDADDYMSILMRQLTETPSAASTIAPELPHTVDDALAWLLAKDPADRPPSLRAAVAALEGGTGADTGPSQQVLDGDVPKATTGVVAAKPASNPWETPPVVAVATRSWLPMIAAGVVVAVAAAVVLVVKPWTSEPAPRPIPTVPIHVPIVLEKPAPKPRPTEAQTVIISVEGVPDGTEVIVGGMTAGAAPGPVQLPRDTAQMVLTFKLDGYLPTSRTIVPDRDQSLVLALKKKPGGVARPRSTKDDIIDLFPQNKR